MVFLNELAKRLTEKESRELFCSGRTFEEMFEQCEQLAKKYGLKVPASFRYTLRNKFRLAPSSAFGRPAKRITIYVYPHMVERIEWLAKKMNITKRLTFMQVINLGLQQVEESWGCMEKYSHGRS